MSTPAALYACWTRLEQSNPFEQGPSAPYTYGQPSCFLSYAIAVLTTEEVITGMPEPDVTGA